MLAKPRWYLLQCKARQQGRAEYHLTLQNFEHYAPRHAVKRAGKGSVETRSEALFPGYVFIRLGEDSNWPAVRATRGVSRLVSFTGAPHPVPDTLIAALEQLSTRSSTPKALFDPGERVVVTQGCFKHVEAIVKSVTADERIIVLMHILQTEQELEMPATQLARIG